MTQTVRKMRMAAYYRAGKINMIITKSISRFARNTPDCLNYVRELKALGIRSIFEKEEKNLGKRPIRFQVYIGA